MKEKITHLKKILQTKDEFQETMNYFFDVLVLDQQFPDAGQITATTNKMKKIIEVTGQKLFRKKKVQIHTLHSIEIKEHKMIHGFVALETMHGAYFYFDKIGGMVSLSGGDDGQVHYCRLTELPDEMILPRNGERFEA